MSDIDLDALEATARAATPGPWCVDSMGEDEPQINVWERRFIATDLPDEAGVHHIVAESEDGHGPNAEHIAAFDPPTVLTLITRLREAEAVIAAALNPVARGTIHTAQGREAVMLRILSRYKTTKTEGNEP